MSYKKDGIYELLQTFSILDLFLYTTLIRKTMPQRIRSHSSHFSEIKEKYAKILIFPPKVDFFISYPLTALYLENMLIKRNI